VIEVFEQEKLLERANSLGDRIKASITAMQSKYSQIAEVRGLGAMIAIELMENGQPAPQYCPKVLTEARNRGLILLSCGTYGNVLRVLVPLTAPDAQVDAGLAIMDEVFNVVFNG